MLRVQGLHKRYISPTGEFLTILENVNFEVKAGEFLAIVGESGSGKSTLLQLLGSLDSPDQGEVFLNGQAIFALTQKEQAKFRNASIGFIYQAHHLIPELSALENVMLPLLIRGEDECVAREYAEGLLKRLNLAHRILHTPSKLSGGEAQRVAVARSLVGSPKLLLADEPTGNLDEKTANEVFLALKTLCREEAAAVVMVTHSHKFAAGCDRVLCLKDATLESIEI